MPLRRRSSPLLAALAAFAAAAVSAGCGRDAAVPAPEASPVRHTFAVKTASAAFTIDGRLREAAWSEAERMGGFRVDADPARVPADPTELRLVLTPDALVAAFVCAGAPPASPDDDACEISIFSRPETPFYSPYLQRLDFMNANESVRTMRRFVVTSANARREANVSKTGPHTPYVIDEGWDVAWRSATARTRRGWVAEVAIPWDSIGGRPAPGHTFRLNVIRTRKAGPGAGPEVSCFDWASSANLHVAPFASESFVQEYPTIFASIRFSPDGRAELERFVETADPWRVERERPEFERALTAVPDPLRSAHFYLGISSFAMPAEAVKILEDKDRVRQEEIGFLEDIGAAGMNGPFLPGFLDKQGLPAIADLSKRFGMRFSFHGYADAKAAQEAGATILTPGGTSAFFDPVYIRMKMALLEKFVRAYGRAPWLADVWGQDEPFNQIATVLQPGTRERVDADIRREFGVGVTAPAGVPGLVYERQPVHEDSRGLPSHETALSRIAAFRWLNKTYDAIARDEYALVRRFAPGKRYEAYNRNAVADMDFLDQAGLWDFTDAFSADPYPSFSIYVYGPDRARYHVGFTSKWVTDFAAGKPAQMILQGCRMIQRAVTPENVREWVSQAAKAGVSMIDWFGTPRLDDPALYREILRVSKLWKTLPKLDVPARSDVAVLFSDDARAAAGDEGLHGHYSLHAILGERLGAWFDFVSDRHVRKGLQSLDGRKLILAPQLGYVSRPFAEEVRRRVEAGATLVLLDPDAFRHDIETGPLDDVRTAVVGAPRWDGKAAARMEPTAAAKARWNLARPLPLRPVRIVAEPRNARAVQPPEGAEVLFTYEDGTPAAYARKLGRGEVLVFGAMPFQDSALATAPGGWEDLLRALLDERGIARDLPLWRFVIPAE